MNLSQPSTDAEEVCRLSDLMELTPTMRRLLAIFADGRQHRKIELRTALDDELTSDSGLHFHLSILRKVLRQRGEDIAVEKAYGEYWYRWVRVIRTSD